MVHDPFSDWLIVRQKVRHTELLAAAEEARLIREAHSTGARKSFACQLLAWLGRNLVSLGARLQDRYGAAGEISAPTCIRG